MALGYDSVDANALPPGASFYFGYVNGNWPNNYHDVKARFPGKPVLGIAVNSTADADCLDVETGDATPADAPGWVSRQIARGLYRPIVYASQSVMPQVLAALTKAGIGRDQVRVWTAHYGVRHLCSPTACGADGFSADATQWAGYPGGGSPGHYDITLARGDFLATSPPPVPVSYTKGTPQMVIFTDSKGEGGIKTDGVNYVGLAPDEWTALAHANRDNPQAVPIVRPGPGTHFTDADHAALRKLVK